MMQANHGPQRTRYSRSGCNPRVLGLSRRSACEGEWAGSLSVGRYAIHANGCVNHDCIEN